MPISGDTYRAGHERIAALVRALPPDELDRAVPACPGWSVRDVVAHLAALAVDVTTGRLTGIPDDAWTATQVRDRAGRDVAEVLGEWAEHVGAVADGVDARRLPLTLVQDVLAHEGDVVEAVGAPRPPADGWAPAARAMARRVVSGIVGPGTLAVRAGDEEWTGGDSGAPATIVAVDLYELYRGLFSRRSRAQMRAWDWTGDPEPWLGTLPVFGPRDDDQPRPASPHHRRPPPRPSSR